MKKVYLTLGALALSTASLLTPAAYAQSNKPNILFIRDFPLDIHQGE